MIKITLLTATVLACTAFVQATNDCKAGLAYCGRTLFEKDKYDYNLISAQAILFMCSSDPGYPGYVKYMQSCGYDHCVAGGTNANDYCA
ncbi:hypothetical protein DFH07DRAFT_964319 [Mycena maculata]|uniref:Uncharacterized protein n=1 Tax=Mycena maculata TaxID=230809 RepID=A0AAD7IH18_9AGAR|nr:hypothetical protein DFH07DRAFT_964319 [Mycena maculata]